MEKLLKILIIPSTKIILKSSPPTKAMNTHSQSNAIEIRFHIMQHHLCQPNTTFVSPNDFLQNTAKTARTKTRKRLIIMCDLYWQLWRMHHQKIISSDSDIISARSALWEIAKEWPITRRKRTLWNTDLETLHTPHHTHKGGVSCLGPSCPS